MDLSAVAGLPISLKGQRLAFSEGLQEIKPTCRSIEDMRAFLRDKDSAFAKRNAYCMYRNVVLPKHATTLAGTGLRYDITVMEHGLIGREFVKTIGHYHPKKQGTKTWFPEVYEVISGKALYIIQKPAGDGKIAQAFLIGCLPGEKVVMPPGFGHVTINPLEKPLVMANIVSDSFESLYDDYRSRHGACHYVIAGGSGIATEKNGSYASVPKLVKAKPVESKSLGIDFNKPLYALFSKGPQRFSWLGFPELFEGRLGPEKCLAYFNPEA